MFVMAYVVEDMFQHWIIPLRWISTGTGVLCWGMLCIAVTEKY